MRETDVQEIDRGCGEEKRNDKVADEIKGRNTRKGQDLLWSMK